MFFKVFQSTLPARGATLCATVLVRMYQYFNPRSPHGERRWRRTHKPEGFHFNPRSPHGERPVGRDVEHRAVGFQSTLPARGATFAAAFQPRADNISIHAPRTGSDRRYCRCPCAGGISIHAPRTGSDSAVVRGVIAVAEFQSTLPARGATLCATVLVRMYQYFNPRSPHGERLPSRSGSEVPCHFNPRSPHGERPETT